MLRYYQRAGDTLSDKLHIVGCAAGSEGNASRELAVAAGFRYVERPNFPLSDKWNAAVTELGDADAVVILGSDDWISHPTLTTYARLVADGVEYIGLRDQFFLDARTRECLKFAGYKGKRRTEPVGVGRCLSRSLLARLGGSPWDSGLRKGLDGNMTKRLRALTSPPRSHVVSMKAMGSGVCALDIKTETNIWGLRELRPICVESRQWTATQHFARQDREELDAAMKIASA